MIKRALIIIDIQCGLFDSAPYPDEKQIILDRIKKLCIKARQNNMLVIWIQHENDDALAHGSAGWQLLPDLNVQAGDLKVRKKTPDSFQQTNLSELLTHHEVRALVVAGYASEFCIDTTVRRAAALGYPVDLAADAHTTHDKPHATAAAIRRHHNHTLSNVTSFGPKISAIPADEIIFS